jgi:hypothetical protein
MVAVLVGSLLYDLAAWLLPAVGVRTAVQSGLFVLTVLAEVVALAELAKLTDDHAPLHRPGVRELLRGFAAVLGYPRFFAEMWLLSMAAAAALFAVYLVQSPLSRLSALLVGRHPWLWPTYTLVAVLGYWACSVGSQRFARHRNRTVEVLLRRSLGLGGTSWLLLLLLPLGLWLVDGSAARSAVLLAGCIVLCLAYNYIRGFIEPYSAATLIRFTQEQGAQVPVSVISGFNSLKRGAHFLTSAVFYLLQQRAPQQDPDARLSQSLCWLAVGFLLFCLPALYGLRSVKSSS